MKEEIIELACKILTGTISEKEIKSTDKESLKEVIELLECNNLSLVKELNQRMMKYEIEKSPLFSLKEYIKREEEGCFYPYPCSYNVKTYKAAVGLIYDDNSFFCNVPLNFSHAEVVTEYMRKKDPNYENLVLFNLNHRSETREWEEKVMEEEHAIVVQLMPNDFGALFYIPEEITPYQQEELENINNLLKENNISTDTNQDDMNLEEYLESIQKKKTK